MPDFPTNKKSGPVKCSCKAVSCCELLCVQYKEEKSLDEQQYQ